MPPLEDIPHDTTPTALAEQEPQEAQEAHEAPPIIPPTNVLVNTTPSQRCTHNFCLLRTNDCCGCNDTRPHNAHYMRYVEAVGDVPIGTRADEYCSNCQRAFASENNIIDRFNRFLAIESNNANHNGLVFTAYQLRDELNNIINQLMNIGNALNEFTEHSMNLT